MFSCVCMCVNTAYSSSCLSVLYVLIKGKHTLVLHVLNISSISSQYVIRYVMFSHTDAPQTSVSISPPGDIQEGTDVTLTCTSTSDLPVKSYSWSKSGHRDLGTEKKYTIKHFRPEDSGWYDCRSLYECGFIL